MKVLSEAHLYELENFENKEKQGQKLQFIEKMTVTQMRLKGVFMPDGSNYPKDLDQLVTINDGTTNQEVIEMLIDRLGKLAAKFPSRENSIAITKLDEALMWLNKRTQDRIKRGVEGKYIK